jgi:hypothetical protein
MYRRCCSRVADSCRLSQVQNDYLEICKLEEKHGASDVKVQEAIRKLLCIGSDATSTGGSLSSTANSDAPIASLPGVVEAIKQQSVFSANELLDDVNTADLRFLLAHFYIGALLLKFVAPKDDQLSLLRRARTHLSVFVGRCKQLALFSEADADALERLLKTMTPQQKREYKVDRFRRQKAARTQLAQMLDKRQKHRALRSTAVHATGTDASKTSVSDRSARDDEDDDGGFDDEAEWRQFELLQLRSALLDASELLESSTIEFDMLEQIAKRREAAGGERQFNAQLESAKREQARVRSRSPVVLALMCTCRSATHQHRGRR